MVMGYLTEEVRAGSILEMLYPDELALAAETPEEVMRKYGIWKSALESKGLCLRVTVSKTKGIRDLPSVDSFAAVDSGRICDSRVDRNLIMCNLCRKWVHGCCIGVRGSYLHTSQVFKVLNVKPQLQLILHPLNSFDDLESVSQFCNLGHTLHAAGGCVIAINEYIKKSLFVFH